MESGPPQVRGKRLHPTEPCWILASSWKLRVRYAFGFPVTNATKLFFSRWYYQDISREQAEYFLLKNMNKKGSFLLRESSNKNNIGGYALSVKDNVGDSVRDFHVKHYKIKPVQTSRGYYITSKTVFPTIPDLVEHYKSKSAVGLCCSLTVPCQTSSSSPSLLSSTEKFEYIPRFVSEARDRTKTK